MLFCLHLLVIGLLVCLPVITPWALLGEASRRRAQGCNSSYIEECDRPSLANVGFDLEKFCDHRGKDGISQKEIFCSRELIRYSMGDVTVTKVRQKKQFLSR